MRPVSGDRSSIICCLPFNDIGNRLRRGIDKLNEHGYATGLHYS